MAQQEWTVDRIRAAMQAAGSHWWGADVMRFFDTRVLGKVVQGPGGVYFVTSEQPPHGPRRASVRRFVAPRTISTIEPFAGLSPRQAHHLAARLAADKCLADLYISGQ